MSSIWYSDDADFMDGEQAMDTCERFGLNIKAITCFCYERSLPTWSQGRVQKDIDHKVLPVLLSQLCIVFTLGCQPISHQRWLIRNLRRPPRHSSL